MSRLNAAGTGLVASTYLGGTGRTIGNGNSNLDATDNGDDGIGVALDAAGDAYVIGVTLSTDFPTTTGAYQTTNKAAANIATNVFVSKLDPTLSTLMYSTYVGGSGSRAQPQAIEVPGISGLGSQRYRGRRLHHRRYRIARFSSDRRCLSGRLRSTQVVDSGFFTEVNPGGSALQYSTYLGGSGAGLMEESLPISPFSTEISSTTSPWTR